MSTITHELKLPRKPQNWFWYSDLHEKHLHQKTYNILIDHALSLQEDQRNLILGGDFLDLPFLMPKGQAFQTWAKRSDGADMYFLPLWEDEIKWGNEKLDELQSVFRNIIFMNGNHDNPRADVYREMYCPAGYKEHFYIGKALNLEKRGIGEIAYGDWLNFGPDLTLTHGIAHGASAAARHYLLGRGRSVIHGHLHKFQKTPFPVRGTTQYVYSMGCGSTKNPHYIKNIDNDWENGYGSFIMMPDGSHYVFQHEIKNDMLVLPDLTIIKGER
jgi:UDP-2,3-diacylglucosamine pyrophosphatase LpxH